MEIADSFAKSFRQNKLDTLKWSKEEKITKASRDRREKVFPKYNLNFSEALLLALQKSVFGCYLNVLNPQQNQDKIINENKMAITEYIIKNLKGKELKTFENNNNLFEDIVNALKCIIIDEEKVEMNYLMKNVQTLRVSDFYINQIDHHLNNISKLQLLILTGNNIQDIEGAFLPRDLRFLELYDNFVENFRSIVKKAPEGILHLGLGRNKLNDHSSYHLLGGSRNFTELTSLDLSDNDIYHSKAVLVELRSLLCLRALQLEGNPCYIEPNYKNTVLKYLPNLVYLDNVEITKEDREVGDFLEDDDKKPEMILLCHRIMGLSAPPKDAKNIQTIHVEVELPLLEKAHLEETKAAKSVNIPDKSSKEIQTAKKDKSSKTTKTESGTNKSSKSSKSAGQKSPYDGPNESDAHPEENNFSFKTARMPWSAVMEFLPVFIEFPERDARAIRDTFWSRVEVRVVYLKVSRTSKGKPTEEKESKTPKKAQTKGTVQASPIDEEPKENILKRVTLCSFNCDLENISWSDESIDYYWADHPQIGRNALRMNGCLKNLIYRKGTDTKQTGGKARGEPQDIQNLIQPIPKIFTCQVGFGLKRI